MSMNQLKQSKNEVCVEGILQEVNLTNDNDKNGRPRIRGKIIIAVDQEYSGKTEHEEVVVNVYAGMYKNDGGENPAYKSISQVQNWKRLSTDGANADRVRFNAGTISENIFTPEGADHPVITWQVGNAFFQKVSGDFNPRAVFVNKIFIHSIKDEERNDEPTGRLVIKGILVGYNGRADVIPYYVEDRKAIDYIRKNWSDGDTVQLGGRLRFTTVMEESSRNDDDENVAFGDEIETTSGRSCKELIVTTGSPSSSDDENSFDQDAIRAAMNDRLNRINESGKQKPKAAVKKNRGW